MFPAFDCNFPAYAIFAENEALRNALYFRKQSEAAELAANQWQDMRLGSFGPCFPAQGFQAADYNRATYAFPGGGFGCANSGHTGQSMDADRTMQVYLASGTAASSTAAVLEHLAGAAGPRSDRTRGAATKQTEQMKDGRAFRRISELRQASEEFLGADGVTAEEDAVLLKEGLL